MKLWAALATVGLVGVACTSAPASVSPNEVQLTITKADDRKTVTVHVGKPFAVVLIGDGPGDTWGMPLDQPGVSMLKRFHLNVRHRSDSVQVAFEALRTGTVTLKAAHGAACLMAKPACEVAAFGYTVTIHGIN